MSSVDISRVFLKFPIDIVYSVRYNVIKIKVHHKTQTDICIVYAIQREEIKMTNEMILKQVRELKSLKLMQKELADEISKIETTLKQEMETQGREKMVVDVFTLSYITVVSHRVDTTALKKELPDIAARYTKESTAKRFTVT